MSKVGLITACSSTRSMPPTVKVQDMPEGLTNAEAMEWWCDKIGDKGLQRTTPGEQYRGTGFNTLTKIQATLGADTRIITGGLGLIGLTDEIVPYDFSASKKEEHNIHQKVTKEPFIQTVWWARINEYFGRSGTPVAKFVLEHDLVVISATKVFLRYIADDILSIPIQYRDRVRILLTESSLGSVPAQLRPMIIPFPRTAVSHLPGNRNDINHRAAQLFFQQLEDDPEWLSRTIEEHAELYKGAQVSQNSALSQQALLDIFDSHPGYLQLGPDQAYLVVKRSHGNPGGKMTFRGVYRLAKASNFEPDKKDVSKAEQALAGMGFLSQVAQGTDEEEAALQALSIFAEAVKGIAPNAVFSTADISNWAKSYYTESEPPGILTSPNKLAYLMRANLGVLKMRIVEKSFALDLQGEA